MSEPAVPILHRGNRELSKAGAMLRVDRSAEA